MAKKKTKKRKIKGIALIFCLPVLLIAKLFHLMFVKPAEAIASTARRAQYER